MPPCPAYLNAITGEGVSRRNRKTTTWPDGNSSWDGGPVFNKLGLKVAWSTARIGSDVRPILRGAGLLTESYGSGSSRQEAYSADITYGTNNEFGFDYLRDNMALNRGGALSRGATITSSWTRWTTSSLTKPGTPLIISGTCGGNLSSCNYTFAKLVPRLKEEDYTIDDRTPVPSP